MKRMKKLVSLAVSIMMVLAMAIPAMAAEETGTITITNAQKDRTYDLYKIFDLTYAGSENTTTVAYTIADKWVDFFAGAGAKYIVSEQNSDNQEPYATVTVEENGTKVTKYIAIVGETGEATEAPYSIAQFAQDALAYAVNLEADKEVKATEDGSLTVDGLALGTYLVYPEGGSEIKEGFASVCSLNSTTPKAEITIKVDYPSVDKKIDGSNDTDDSTSGLVEANTSSIGDKVPFVITGEVPDMTGYKYYYYILKDTLSKGLTFNNDVKVTIGSTELGSTAVTVTQDIDDPQKITINLINFIQYAEQVGAKITVEYSATLDEDAVIGNDGNTNTVQLLYSNDPTTQKDGEYKDEPSPNGPEYPKGQDPEKTTTTYATGITLKKVDGNGSILTGAKFSISGTKQNVVVINETIYKPSENGTYYRLTDGTYTEEAPTIGGETDNTEKYDSTTQKYDLVEVITKDSGDTEDFVADGYVDEKGTLTFEGLGNGTYTITELVAPAGYNLLVTPIEVTVKYGEDSQGNKVEGWSFTSKDTTLQLNESGTGTVSFNVINQSGSLLPSTGGIGTTIFYVIGGIMVVGAGVLLVTKKRVKAGE